MNRDQMLGSLQRIFVLQYFKAEEIGPYGETIFEQCAWMDAYKFEQAVKEVVKTLKTNQRLKPAHFISAYHRLAEEKGWNTGLTFTCHTCNGYRFFRVWLKDKKGLEFQAAKGCGQCNQRYSSVHSDFTEISGPTFEPIDQHAALKLVGPMYAQALLNIADAFHVELKPAVSEALMEAAAKQEPPRIAPRHYNHVTRKNELVRSMIETPEIQGEAEREAAEEPGSAAGISPPPAQVQELSVEDLEGIPF